jgi:predicted anti-sigma-YlaC factor YlaD
MFDMRCDEIQEQFVDLLYHEKGTPAASAELQEHLRSCPGCRKELAGLQGLRLTLKAWQDEPPLRPTRIPRAEPAFARLRFPVWRLARYAAFAALLTLAFLALSNAEIRWDHSGFSFQTHLLSKATQPSADYYTREETREIFNRVLNDSQGFTLQMIQKAMTAQDQLRVTDLRFVSNRINQSRGKN